MRRRQSLYALAGSPVLAAPARAEPDYADDNWLDAARPGCTLPARLRSPAPTT